jgi:hypothetical protein
LQLLLILASAVTLRSESYGTHDQILLSQIPDSSNLEGQVPVFISPRKRVARLYPPALGTLFVALYDSQGYDGCIRPASTLINPSLNLEPYITTDGQSANLAWNKAPICGLRPDFCYCQTVASLLMWGALSDERTGLSFAIAADPQQRSHSQVPIPWDSRPYFTVSDSRLPFSSLSTTRRVKVEVFYPASTRVYSLLRKRKLIS